MERKGGSSTVVVTREEVRAAMAKVRTLTSEEDKTLRMRHGVGAIDLKAPLARAASGNEELGDELLLIEMQLLRSMRARAKTPAAAPVAQRAQAGSSRMKDKIVRALRKKK